MTPAGFPHSDTPGSTLGCQLPRAYRRLLRPSSALDAKASTMCPSQLVTHTTNPTHPPHPTHTKTPHTTHPHPQTAETHGRHTGHHMRNTRVAGYTRLAVHTRHNYKELKIFDARVHYPDLKQQPHTRKSRAHHTGRPIPGREPTTPTPTRTQNQSGTPHAVLRWWAAEQPHPTTPAPADPPSLGGNPPGSGWFTGLIPQNPNSVPPPASSSTPSIKEEVG